MRKSCFGKQRVEFVWGRHTLPSRHEEYMAGVQFSSSRRYAEHANN